MAAASSSSDSAPSITAEYIKKRFRQADDAVKWRRQNNYNINAFPAISTLIPPDMFDKLTNSVAETYKASQPKTKQEIETLWAQCLVSHLTNNSYFSLEQLAIIQASYGYVDLFVDLSLAKIREFQRPKKITFPISSEGNISFPDPQTMQAFLSDVCYESYKQADVKNQQIFYNRLISNQSYKTILSFADQTISIAQLNMLFMLYSMSDPLTAQAFHPYIIMAGQ